MLFTSNLYILTELSVFMSTEPDSIDTAEH